MHFRPGARPPASIRLWSLREEVFVETDADTDALNVITQWGEIEIDRSSPAMRDGLNRMSLGPVDLTHVPGLDQAEQSRLLALLGSCVVHSLGIDDLAGLLLSAVPISADARFALPELHESEELRLSRFTAMRTGADGLVLESPLAHYRMELHRPLAAWVVGTLGRPTTAKDIAGLLAVDLSLIAEVLGYLIATGMVVVAKHDEKSDTPAFDEDRDPGLIPWSHHDLLFHSRSRAGRHDDSMGAVYRYVGKIPPLPVVKPTPDGQRFPLHKPEIDELPARDPSLTEAIESRESVRRFADRPPSAEQVGELLFRTARIRRLMEVSGTGGSRYTVSDRPYPSSDSLYELELYVTMDRCEGLPRGIYHYDPLEHALTLINTEEPRLAELLDDAMVLTGTMQRPPVLITMTARMARLSWTYDGIAYSTALKHVGVLQQTLYLVATAMGLAPCALVVGDSDAATQAFHLDWPAEISIGEFVIGLRAG